MIVSPEHIVQSLLQRVALRNPGCEEWRDGELGVAAVGVVGGGRARHSHTVGKTPGYEGREGCW